MTKLKDGAYTGSSKKGNPYEGDLGKGINYDTYEAIVPHIVQDGNFPKIVTNYRFGARKLVEFSSVRGGQRVLDLGSGTGISTLELLTQKQGVCVTGVEISEGMLLVAKYKFYQDDGKELTAQVTDEKLLQYWADFRKESKKYRDLVEFQQGDFQDVDDFSPESVDAAVANQFMHWTDLSKSFEQLRKFLKDGGEVIWNSASHFYNDAQFPAAEYGFRYNDFFAYVLNDVCERFGATADDYRSLAKPPHNLESIKSISGEQGFETEQVATFLKTSDLQTFVQNHVPVFVRQLVHSDDNERIRELTREAIERAIVNPKALKDTQHKYEITPIFRSVKK